MLTLNSLFQKGAVLQQKKEISVWGNTEQECKLKAEFAGQTVFSMSSLTGKFIFRFSPVDAGGPFVLKVTNLASGEVIEVDDILVGEVWLASGQSNMDYQLGSNWAVVPPYVEDFELSGINEAQLKEFCTTTKNTDKLRYFCVEKNVEGRLEDTAKGSWEYLSAENASGCSAVAAWFARYIQEKLNVPVGVIVSAWGGTCIEAWTSRNGLIRNPETREMITAKDNTFRNERTWLESSEEAKKDVNFAKYADPGNKGVGNGWAELDFDDSAWQDMAVPGSWIAQSISGNGALWARTKVTVPENWIGKELTLNLGGIDKTDISYFNGVEIGRTGEGVDVSCWCKKRVYTIPAELVKPGENIIAVRAYSFYFDGSFNGIKKHYFLACGDESIPLAGTWKVCAELDLGIIAPALVGARPRNHNVPSILFEGMINPLIPYAMRGVIWYQGESNTANAYASNAYYDKLRTMIEDWRFRWELGDFPFIQVQLANFFRNVEGAYDKNSSWAILRNTQRRVCNDMKNVYMASAIDIGEFYDIHPQDKKSVGKRLADNALCNVYCCNDTVPFGPLYMDYCIEGGKIRLFFRYTDGMYLKENAEQSFYVAGQDKVFYPADSVKIEGSSLLVSSAQVESPAHVRYAWADYPFSTLYNGAELPASPFTTEK